MHTGTRNREKTDIPIRKAILWIGKAGLIFICTLAVLCGLFLLSARIPREAVREHILEAAKEMESEGDRYDPAQGRIWMQRDNYADAAWLNILYSLDAHRPWQTMLESPIYVDFDGKPESMTHALALRVQEELPANTVYDRYWHGTILLLRPLLVFLRRNRAGG